MPTLGWRAMPASTTAIARQLGVPESALAQVWLQDLELHQSERRYILRVKPTPQKKFK